MDALFTPILALVIFGLWLLVKEVRIQEPL
jgi:hypothetical protein